MDDLIRRQDAIELIENESRKWGDEYGVSDVLCDLADLPSAQPEIVRCKDCRHRDPEDHKCDSGEMERQGCPFKVADDYFCAYGER